jgi:muconolactone delta-isomerase
MQFLVEFEIEVPARTLDEQVEQHQRAESAAAAKLAEEGNPSAWRIVTNKHHGDRNIESVPGRTTFQVRNPSRVHL